MSKPANKPVSRVGKVYALLMLLLASCLILQAMQLPVKIGDLILGGVLGLIGILDLTGAI